MAPFSDQTGDVERLRPRLLGIAYRMLGDVHDAEDLVQEAFLRWQQADRAAVGAPEGWLVAVVTRLAIDRLRRGAAERAVYVGPWLPEPIATDGRSAPDRSAELASDLSMAFLVLLERLAPEERAAFLLREVFDTGYDEIARILGKSEAAARQIVHRAKARVRSDRARFAAAPDAQERLLHRFLAALEADDKEALLAVFAPDATFTSDGGGRVPAARNVVVGPERIARCLLGLARKGRGRVTHRIVRLNDEPALLTYADGRVLGATAFAADGERIHAMFRVMNPDKLRHVSHTRLSPA
jgi:RNA polymerase sigma-70 factor (ECF subfamily)